MEENIFKEQILARLQQAVETLEDAKTMFKTQSYRSSINRAYYSMFYSAHALVYLTNENKSKHVGIIEVFVNTIISFFKEKYSLFSIE